ncbi:MAG: IMP dehydrogenase [Candidatus Ozemobacteraceae bacterium]
MPRTLLREPSRAIAEFRLLPGLTTDRTSVERIDLKTRLALLPRGNGFIHLNVPMVSAAMQAVSGTEMGTHLAREGGLAFLFSSQTPENQAKMVAKIKNHKAGFVKPQTIHPDVTISELAKRRKTLGFSIFPVVNDDNVLLGMISKNDYEESVHGSLRVSDRMIPRGQLVVGQNLTDLRKANDILIESHHGVLPILDNDGKLVSLVFRKDIHNHLHHPFEVIDDQKRLLAAAALNTHDHTERLPLLVEAGVDIVCIDSSDGHAEYQRRVIEWIRSSYPDLPVVGGNIITGAGFQFLVDSGACAVKIGMGGGSICITQEQKGTGRGLGTAIIEVVQARDAYFQKTGAYIPLIADGGIGTGKDIVIALALGADVVMLGRYFARFEESPTEKINIKNRVMKPYWGEGAPRAREWRERRYRQDNFAEGVEGYVEYAGSLHDNLVETLAKVRSTFSTCGVATIAELHENAVVEVVSGLSIREGRVHDIHLPEGDSALETRDWGA